MINLSQFFTDDYDRETLLVPAMSTVTVPVIVATLLGFNINILFGIVVLGVEIGALIVWLAANTIRDAGRALEKNLFNGVFPTTQCLRLREQDDYETKARRDLLQRITGVTLLQKAAEIRDPHEADQRIKHATEIAKEKMRDPKKYYLLRRELKSYGFWRNIIAVKWWGFNLAVLSVLCAVVLLYFAPSSSKSLPYIAVLVSLFGCFYWLIVVTKERVITAADRYKEQFFKSLSITG